MAITFVGAGVYAAAASGSVSPALPAGCLKDDLLVLDCGLSGSDTLACSGYTKKAEYAAGGSAAGMDLVVTLEMVGRPIRSETGQDLYQRSQIRLDPADYDGASYYFEIVATTDTTTSYDVELYDVTNSAVEATIATGTTAVSYVRMRSTAFTPATDNSIFAVRMPATTSQGDISVFAARIVVVQSGATKTRLQIPLVNGAYSAPQGDSSAGPCDSTTSATYAQTTPGRYPLWLKEASKLATIAAGTPWTLEAVVSNSDAAQTTSVALYNATDNLAVTGAEVSKVGNALDICTAADFADNATNFTDLDEYEVRLKTSDAARTAYIYSANLYVKLTSLTKALVHTRISMASASTSGATNPYQRIYYDAGQWSTGAVWYSEATASDASASPIASVYVRYDTADDSGTGDGSLGTTLTFAAARDRQRSTALTMTDEYRYMGRTVNTTGTLTLSSQFLVAELEVAGATTGGTQVTRFWKRHTGTESAPTVTGASDSIVAYVHAFRGVDLGADPWDAYDAALLSAPGASVSFPSMETATNGAMVVGAAATADNNAYDPAYAQLADLVAPSGVDYANTILGSDASIACVYGVQAVAGDIGVPGITQTAGGPDLYVSTIGALKPASAPADFNLNIAAKVADQWAADWPQAQVTSYGATGSATGDMLSIVGTDLGTDGTVSFGATAAVITMWTTTQVRCLVPAVADGSYAVQLTPSGNILAPAPFTFVVAADVVPLAVITSITPSSGIVGATVTIVGTDFTSAGVVTIGATAMTQVSYTNTLIRVTVPDIALGDYSVRVTPTGRTASSPVDFTIVATVPDVPPVETNPLFDGTLAVVVGGLDVTDALLPGLRYSSANPGGFGEATMRLPASDPGGPYDAAGCVAKGAAVTITHGSETLFAGELTGDVSHAVVTGGEAHYELTAAGLWWKAGRRGDFRRTWGDGDPSRWFEMSSGGVFEVDVDGKLDIRLPAGQTAKNGAAKSLYYWLDDGMGSAADDIGYFIGLVGGRVLDKGSAAWHAELLSSDSPWGTWTVEESWDNETVSDGTPLLVTMASEGVKALRLKLYVDTAASTGTTADRYIRLSSFSVLGADFTTGWNDLTTAGTPTRIRADAAHGLKTGDRIFINGFGTTPDISGWRTVTVIDADEFTIPITTTIGTSDTFQWFVGPRIDAVLADIAVTDNLATDSDVQSGGIGNVNWSFNVRPHMSRAEAIEQVAAMHSSPLSYGFWDDATFFCYENPYANARVYLIDSTAPGIDAEAFRATEESPTHVKLLYGFRDVVGGSEIYPEGTVLSVYRPSEPYWDDAAYVLDVWDEWSDVLLETAQAEAIGDQILSWIDANQWEGRVSIATPTVTDTSVYPNAERNTAYIRAGDFLVDLSLSDMALWRITSMEMDVDSGTATLGIGESRAEFVARMVPRRPRKVIGKKRVNGKWVKIWGDA